ncbi:MAG TPA: tetratricopeptide repeat protein [Xanthobacteraceae bacterium]|nr:tetratricopeptide repeat protein [Xanthobacteraceae bacterium]
MIVGGGFAVGIGAAALAFAWLSFSHSASSSGGPTAPLTNQTGPGPVSPSPQAPQNKQPTDRASIAPPTQSGRIADREPNQQPAAPAAAKLGEPLQSALAVAQMNAAIGRDEYAEAQKMADKLAAKGNAAAIFEQGILLQFGPEKDLTRARERFRTSYKLGNPLSAFALGRLLEEGLGGPPDIEQAKRLYIFAAASGVPVAQQALQRLHIENELGTTATQDYEKIRTGNGNAADFARLQSLVEAPSTSAMCLMGWLYLDGKSVPVDYAKAQQLLQPGAAEDNALCEWGMGLIATIGTPGFPRNDEEADGLLRLSVRNATSGSFPDQVRRQIATVEERMNGAQKSQVVKLLQDALQPSATATNDAGTFSLQAWQAAPRPSGEWSRLDLARRFLKATRLEGSERGQVLTLLGEPGYSGVEYDSLGAGPIGGSDFYRLTDKNDWVLGVVYDAANKVTRAMIDNSSCDCYVCDKQAPTVPNDVVNDVVAKKDNTKQAGNSFTGFHQANPSMSIAGFESLIGRGGKRLLHYDPGSNTDPRLPSNARSDYDDVWRIDGGGPHRFLDASGTRLGGLLDKNLLGERTVNSYTIIKMYPECLPP